VRNSPRCHGAPKPKNAPPALDHGLRKVGVAAAIYRDTALIGEPDELSYVNEVGEIVRIDGLGHR